MAIHISQLLLGLITGLAVGLVSGAYLLSRARHRGVALHWSDDVLIVLLTLAAFALGLFVSYAFG